MNTSNRHFTAADWAWLFNPLRSLRAGSSAPAPIEQAAPARLTIPNAPSSGYDVSVNDAIVTHIRREGARTFAQLGEVFLPAPAAGCNRGHEKALKQRLTYLCATGRLVRTHGTVHTARYHLPSTQP